MESTRTIRTFKAYPKNEQIYRHPLGLSEQMKREPHLIHNLLIDYYLTGWTLGHIPSNRLFKSLEKINIINSFGLFLYQISKQDITSRNLSLKLKSLSSLQSLDLKFSDGGWLSLKGITRLAHAIAELKRLSKLTLCLKTCWELNDECFHVLFKSLRKHRNLQSFNFDLSNCRKITDKTFKDLASILTHSLRSLEEFSFAMSNHSLTKGRALDFLDNGLASLTRLQKLKILMLNVQISPETDCNSFPSSLQHLKSLRVLDLDLSSLHNCPATLSRLATSFNSLINLKKLSLNLRYGETCFEQEMEILAQSFQSLSLIERLTLDFNDSLDINDQALEKLSVGIKTLIKLSEVTLSFDQCPEVGDAGVESIISALENLPSLNSVALSFLNCGPIKDEYQNRLLQVDKNCRKISIGESEYIY